MGLFDRLKGSKEQHEHHAPHSGAARPGMAIDPVCHMEVDPKTAKWSSRHGSSSYYFCAPGCKSSFDADPHRYLGAHSH